MANKETIKKTEDKNLRIRVTMIHGLGSCTKRQIATAKALRLARPGDTRELPKSPATLGACKKLEHLVKIEEVSGMSGIRQGARERQPQGSGGSAPVASPQVTVAPLAHSATPTSAGGAGTPALYKKPLGRGRGNASPILKSPLGKVGVKPQTGKKGGGSVAIKVGGNAGSEDAEFPIGGHLRPNMPADTQHAKLSAAGQTEVEK